VALFVLGVTATVALLSAVWPAVDLSRHSQHQPVGHGRQTVGVTRDRRRVTRGLQTAQVATALVLAVAAGLFATSFARLMNADLGFETRGLATVSYSFPNGRYQTDESQYAAVAEILERIRAVPGVRQAVTGASPAASHIGLYGDRVRTDSRVERGRPACRRPLFRDGRHSYPRGSTS